MRLAKSKRARNVGVILAAAGMVAAGTVGLATNSQAATATYTLSPKTGPGGTNAGGQPASGAKVLTITGTGFKTGATTNVANVRWIAKGTACAVTATALATFSVPSATKITATVPADTLALTATTTGGVTTYTKKDYTLCVYNGAGTPVLLGSATYTVYPVPTIDDPLTPTKGSASGGETVTVAGTGFTSASVVRFGSTLGTGVKVATDGKSLTVKAPAGTASATAVEVSVTTEGGAATVGTGTDNDYTYLNAISVSPVTGTGTLGDVITVTGTGFTAAGYDWTSAVTVDTASAIQLFQGAYTWDDTVDNGINDDAAGTCGTVQVVSDTELVCKLVAAVPDGAYTVYVVEDKSDDTTETAVSSSATYTAADF